MNSEPFGQFQRKLAERGVLKLSGTLELCGAAAPAAESAPKGDAGTGPHRSHRSQVPWLQPDPNQEPQMGRLVRVKHPKFPPRRTPGERGRRDEPRLAGGAVGRSILPCPVRSLLGSSPQFADLCLKHRQLNYMGADAA